MALVETAVHHLRHLKIIYIYIHIIIRFKTIYCTVIVVSKVALSVTTKACV